MNNCSEELTLIVNLRNTALDHKNYCNTNCSVSLGQLRQAAIYIQNGLMAKRNSWDLEVIETTKYISEMPIS